MDYFFLKRIFHIKQKQQLILNGKGKDALKIENWADDCKHHQRKAGKSTNVFSGPYFEPLLKVAMAPIIGPLGLSAPNNTVLLPIDGNTTTASRFESVYDHKLLYLGVPVLMFLVGCIVLFGIHLVGKNRDRGIKRKESLSEFKKPKRQNPMQQKSDRKVCYVTFPEPGLAIKNGFYVSENGRPLLNNPLSVITKLALQAVKTTMELQKEMARDKTQENAFKSNGFIIKEEEIVQVDDGDEPPQYNTNKNIGKETIV